jgi:hypothetical protein
MQEDLEQTTSKSRFKKPPRHLIEKFKRLTEVPNCGVIGNTEMSGLCENEEQSTNEVCGISCSDSPKMLPLAVHSLQMSPQKMHRNTSPQKCAGSPQQTILTPRKAAVVSYSKKASTQDRAKQTCISQDSAQQVSPTKEASLQTEHISPQKVEVSVEEVLNSPNKLQTCHQRVKESEQMPETPDKLQANLQGDQTCSATDQATDHTATVQQLKPTKAASEPSLTKTVEKRLSLRKRNVQLTKSCNKKGTDCAAQATIMQRTERFLLRSKTNVQLDTVTDSCTEKGTNCKKGEGNVGVTDEDKSSPKGVAPKRLRSVSRSVSKCESAGDVCSPNKSGNEANDATASEVALVCPESSTLKTTEIRRSRRLSLDTSTKVSAGNFRGSSTNSRVDDALALKAGLACKRPAWQISPEMRNLRRLSNTSKVSASNVSGKETSAAERPKATTSVRETRSQKLTGLECSAESNPGMHQNWMFFLKFVQVCK